MMAAVAAPPAVAVRLRGAILRPEQRSSSFLQGLADLEGALKSRQATVDAAVRAPGATADSVVDSIISESHAVESATENMSGSSAAGSGSEAQPMASAKTMQDALQSPQLPPAGHRARVAHYPHRRRPLPRPSNDRIQRVRDRPPRIRLRHGQYRAHAPHALGKILESRQEAPAYFGMVLTADR
jgi:hypothetical protein